MSHLSLAPITTIFAFPNTFTNKEEAIQLHQHIQALDAQLKFRKELEISYAKLKLDQLKEEKDEMDFQNEFAEIRNEKILDGLQKDIFQNISNTNITEQSRKKLDIFKEKYRGYLDYHRAHIMREYNYQVLTKQNALLAERAILSNQVNQNERQLKMENEYCDRIHKTNKQLLEQIQILQLQNAKVDQERRKKALQYEAMENELLKQMKQKDELALLAKEDDENNIKQSLDKSNNLQASIVQTEEVKNKEKKMRITTEKIVTLNMNHRFGKLDQIRQSQLDATLLKEKEEEEMKKSHIKHRQGSIISLEGSVLNQTNQLKESNMTFNNDKLISKQDSPKKIQESQPIDIGKSQDQDKHFGRGITFGETVSKEVLKPQPQPQPQPESQKPFQVIIPNSTIIKPMKSSIVSNQSQNQVKEPENEIDKIKLSQSINISQNGSFNPYDQYANEHPHDSQFAVRQRESAAVKQTIQINNPSIVIPPQKVEPEVKDINDSLEFIHNNENNNENIKEDLVINPSQKLSEGNDPETKQIHYEKMIATHPNLSTKLVLAEYKLLVLKKLIPKIEKYSKTQKPGKQVYLIKHTNTKTNTDVLKEKFYELLISIKTDETQDDAFSTLEMNIALQMVFEILYSNPIPNLNESNLANKKIYDEDTFNNDMEEHYREIIRTIMDHMKLMVNLKKISLQLACTFMAKGLLNFNHTETMNSKLLLILEKNLSQKNANNSLLFANTFSSGLNAQPKIFYQTKKTDPMSISASANLKKSTKEDVFDQYQ